MSRFLLDTCTLLDWAVDASRLQDDARIAIADARSHVFVSAATAWEIGIKRAVGKLNAPDDIAALLQANRFVELPVTIAHAQATAELPMHHKDPFDRLLIAQARTEALTLITRDEAMREYDVPCLAA